MVGYLDFDYDTIEGETLNIKAQVDGPQLYFKAFKGTKRITKGSLTTLDLKNIEEFIKENVQDEIEFESDLYERQND